MHFLTNVSKTCINSISEANSIETTIFNCQQKLHVPPHYFTTVTMALAGSSTDLLR